MERAVLNATPAVRRRVGAAVENTLPWQRCPMVVGGVLFLAPQRPGSTVDLQPVPG
ncbi:MAG: hypothetical protein ACRDTA_28975 [Pseudonocardiaceae bacterium]